MAQAVDGAIRPPAQCAHRVSRIIIGGLAEAKPAGKKTP
jgi:hypothetical protein